MTDDLCTWSDLPRHTCDHCRLNAVVRAGTVTAAEAAANITAALRHAATPAITARPMRVVYPTAHQDPTPEPRGARQLIEDTNAWDLHDYVAALCDTTRHAQPFLTPQRNPDGTVTFVQQRHYTTSPPLLEQLWSAAEQSGSAEGGRRAFGSKPSARLEAIDVAVRVDTEVHEHLTRLGVTDSHDAYPDTIPAVRHLASLALRNDDVRRTVRSWWTAARVVTGWDSPAWRPDNTCPLCAVRGGLRIRLDLHSGVCVECHETWGPESIGLLADHIRLENHEDEQDEADAG